MDATSLTRDQDLVWDEPGDHLGLCRLFDFYRVRGGLRLVLIDAGGRHHHRTITPE